MLFDNQPQNPLELDPSPHAMRQFTKTGYPLKARSTAHSAREEVLCGLLWMRRKFGVHVGAVREPPYVAIAVLLAYSANNTA